MRLARASALLVMILLAARPANAQLCAGNPSYTNQPYQAALTAAFTEDAHGIGGEFGAGGESIFASAGVSVINFRNLDALSTQISALVGADLPADQNRTVFVCPAASIGFSVGPDVGAVDISTISLGAGGSVGVVASQMDQLTIVPTFGLAVIYNRITADFGGIDSTASDGSGRATVGVGFIFGQNVGITPAIVIPFSAEGEADSIFSLRLSFGFGR
jgi:hypothetical protein